MNFLIETTYSPDLKNDVKNLVEKNKVVVIRDAPEDLNLNEYYSELGNSLGLLFKKDVDPINKKIIHDSWTTIKFDERYIEQTYKHSNKHQPLHTDYCNASIDLSLVLLICQEAAPIGGATFFIDGEHLIHILKEYKIELYNKLSSQEVFFGTSAPVFRNKAKVIDFDTDGNPILHWNYAVIAPDNNREILEICDEFHEFLEEYIVNGGVATKVYLSKNEAVIMNDKKVLHGRDAFLGNRFLLKGAVATSNLEDAQEIMKQIQ